MGVRMPDKPPTEVCELCRRRRAWDRVRAALEYAVFGIMGASTVIAFVVLPTGAAVVLAIALALNLIELRREPSE